MSPGGIRGEVHILFPGHEGETPAYAKISDWEGSFDGILYDWDRFGFSLAAPGDLDGDGVPDLVVASKTEVWVLWLRADGSVRSHRGFGERNGGFVPISEVRSIAIVHGDGVPYLLVAGHRAHDEGKQRAAVWAFSFVEGGRSLAPFEGRPSAPTPR